MGIAFIILCFVALFAWMFLHDAKVNGSSEKAQDRVGCIGAIAILAALAILGMLLFPE